MLEPDTKKILITGASSDVAAPLLDHFRNRKGYEFFLVSGSRSPKTHGLKVLGSLNMNLAQRENIIELLGTVSEIGVTHFLQFHGGTVSSQSLEELGLESHQEDMDLNLFSTQWILKGILPGMKERGYGRIVLMNTASSEHGGGLNSFSYGMAKHGVDFLVKYVAKYYAKHEILCNGVSPGFIETKIHQEQFGRSLSQVEDRKALVPLKRAGQAKDVAKAYVHLGFENQFINGANLVLDGGDFL
jgi:NAD(P)-dependent dehydrogenase (short-subunit alcohol dehydrogenase family)